MTQGGSDIDAPTILVVCTGNLCRSPYIERRLQAELDRSWGPAAVRVHSAGTDSRPGLPMEVEARRRLQDAGGSGEGFMSTRLTQSLVADASLIITATRWHRSRVARIHPRALRTAHALRDLAYLSPHVQRPQAASDTTARAWLDAVARAVAAARGRIPPLPPEDAGIDDPIGKSGRAFDTMAAEIEQAIPPVVSMLARP
ncbi:MAG: hypothetical protein ABI746_00010 [Dermatophilaceae bacterium]